MSSSSYGHTVRLMTTEMASRAAERHAEWEALMAEAARSGTAVKPWVAAKSYGACRTGKCQALAVYVTSYRYVTGRRGRTTQRDVEVCPRHAEAFATKNGLEPPPAPSPEGYEAADIAYARSVGACLVCGGRGRWPGADDADVVCSRCGGKRLDPARGELWFQLSAHDPAELRRRADVLESQQCTGVAASWCPIHDTCTCPRDDEGGREDMNDPDCPLHSPESSHAAASVAECQGGS